MLDILVDFESVCCGGGIDQLAGIMVEGVCAQVGLVLSGFPVLECDAGGQFFIPVAHGPQSSIGFHLALHAVQLLYEIVGKGFLETA